MTTTANCVFSAWFLLHVFVPLMSWGGQRKQIGTLLFSVGFPFDIMHKEISLIHVWHTDSYQRRRLPIALLPRSTSDETPQNPSRKKNKKSYLKMISYGMWSCTIELVMAWFFLIFCELLKPFYSNMFEGEIVEIVNFFISHSKMFYVSWLLQQILDVLALKNTLKFL